VRSVPYGEADLVVTLFTEARGLVGAIARSARRASKRFASLEPIHLLSVTLEERPQRELGTLVGSTLARPRLHVSSSLERLEAAGRVLRWVRRAAPPHTPEPPVWKIANTLLDQLGDPSDPIPPEARLVGAGFRLLAAVGWGLDLEQCVSCGRACDASAAASVDAARGGLVCRACGGARVVLRAERRLKLAAAMAGDETALDAPAIAAGLELIEAALAAHAGPASPEGTKA
jgi:DNA repair protein RecO (recombination protein O)